MRKNITLSLALLVASMSPALLIAADKQTSKRYHRMHGDIASVDAAAKTFTIKHGNDTSTFTIDDSTKFRGAGKEISFADLQVGDDVRVSFIEDGTIKTAARIDVAHSRNPCSSHPSLPQCRPKKH